MGHLPCVFLVIILVALLIRSCVLDENRDYILDSIMLLILLKSCVLDDNLDYILD